MENQHPLLEIKNNYKNKDVTFKTKISCACTRNIGIFGKQCARDVDLSAYGQHSLS